MKIPFNANVIASAAAVNKLVSPPPEPRMREPLYDIEEAIARASDALHNSHEWEAEGVYAAYITPALDRLSAALTLATQRAEAAEAERDRRRAYDDEMGRLVGLKLHYQDGLEVGGETLRGAIKRILAAYDVADKERAIYLARWEDRTKQLDDLIEAAEKMRAERDALRTDAARMDALQSETDRFDPVVALVVKCRHDRNGSDWANIAGDIRAALDAALAVQPTTEAK